MQISSSQRKPKKEEAFRGQKKNKTKKKPKKPTKANENARRPARTDVAGVARRGRRIGRGQRPMGRPGTGSRRIAGAALEIGARERLQTGASFFNTHSAFHTFRTFNTYRMYVDGSMFNTYRMYVDRSMFNTY